MSQTPTPWHVCHQNRIHDAAHRSIAELAMDDAAFIVQACNAHHALVEAMREIEQMLIEINPSNYDDDDVEAQNGSVIAAIRTARAALALAQKEQP
jgi:DNA-directed RNA polymerase subunit K/omega